MQPSMEHFGELRQLLHTGQYENDGRQPVIPRSTRARPAQLPDTLVFSAQQHPAARPPLARTGVAAATRSRRPPPAPVAPHQGSMRVPASRHAANRNDIDLYLSQLNHHQPSQQEHRTTLQAPSVAAAPDAAVTTAAAAAQQPAPEQHRRAKRGKPMARRSLQALFDLAAEDSSTWQTSGASTAGGDTEDDGDTGFFASATSGDSSLLLHTNSDTKPALLVSSVSDADAAAAAAVLAGLPGPSTPANCDSGLLGEAAAAMGTFLPGSRPESPLDAATITTAGGTAKNLSQDHLSSIVPLRHLLMSERGRTLTALEAKAIILRVAEDLAALHAANAVHRRVSIESISLTTCLASGGNTTSTTTRHNGDGSRPSTSNATQEENGIAVAILPPGRSTAVLGSNRCYWALKDPVFDAEHAPPEVACCPVDRPVAFTPAGDMWGLGVVLFSLLSAGRVPFSAPSSLCGLDAGGVIGDKKGEDSCTAMASTVDALQCRIYNHISCQIDVINQLSAAQAAGTAGLHEEDFLEMAAIGFDSEAKKMLLGLLHADPAQRFCADDVLNHPWIAEAIPFVPKMPPSTVPFMQKSTVSPGGVGFLHKQGNNRGGNTDGNRETSPPISDVVRRTEQLGFTPQGTNPTTALTAPAAAECPYPIIGHVAQPLEVVVAGRKVIISALHAVYNVPGYGAMMSAAPVAAADPAEVAAAAAAAAAANGHLHIAAEQGGTAFSQFLNLGGAS